jgi:hypothetical protein
VQVQLFVQDNGAQMQLYPFEQVAVEECSGIEKTMNFLLMDSPQSGWDLIQNDNEPSMLIEKQVHCCLLLDPNNGTLVFYYRTVNEWIKD